MAAESHLAVVLVVLFAAVVGSVHSAGIDTGVAAAPAPGPGLPPLAVRLHRAFSVTLDDAGGDQDGSGGGGITECWGALAQLGSCTSEILIFLVNGESYIGPECCRAIRGATRHCWPAMLASVGFTAEQADVLRGFCDGEAAASQRQGGGSNTNTTPPPAGNNTPPPAGKP